MLPLVVVTVVVLLGQLLVKQAFALDSAIRAINNSIRKLELVFRSVPVIPTTIDINKTNTKLCETVIVISLWCYFLKLDMLKKIFLCK